MPIFGPPPVNAKELADALIKEINAALTPESSDTEWTKRIKESLRLIAEVQSFVVAPDPQNDECEFLCDFVWWKNRDLNDIVLAVESEWGDASQVWHDFGKLMVVKAPLKLLVFSTSNHARQSESVRETIESKYMMKYCHHIAGEQYLLLEFAVPDRMAFAYLFDVQKDGKLTSVRFQEILSARLWKPGDRRTLRQFLNTTKRPEGVQ